MTCVTHTVKPGKVLFIFYRYSQFSLLFIVFSFSLFSLFSVVLLFFLAICPAILPCYSFLQSILHSTILFLLTIYLLIHLAVCLRICFLIHLAVCLLILLSFCFYFHISIKTVQNRRHLVFYALQEELKVLLIFLIINNRGEDF